jgi:uncharacterized membrane protein YgdD (TMEM256/DUF423 family)
MHKIFLIIATSLACVAVILGAFGAHGLKELVPPESISTFETGVRYHFYHSFALLVSGILYERFRNKWIRFAGYGFITGIVLFSGSLYALTFLKASHNVGLRGLGLVTPIGGLFFIAGWIALIIAFNVKNQSALKSM